MASNYPHGFSHGVTIRNVPILNTYSGNVFWVSSTNGSAADATGQGTYDKPFATIDYAIGRCAANHGDIIMVAANHAETVSAAGGIDCDVEGIRIIGLGEGDDRPTISFTAAESDIDIDADNVTIENLIFLADFATGVTATIDVNKEYFTMRDCWFIGNAATKTHLISVITDANANDMTIENCKFQLLVAEDGSTAITTTSTEAIRLVGADRATIKNNYVSGDFTTAAINAITTACKDILILDNLVNNIATENITGAIDLVAASTGYMDGNKCYAADPTAATDIIDSSSLILGYNYITNAAAEQPAIFGTADVSDKTASVGVLASTISSKATSVGTKTSTAVSQGTIISSKATSVGTKASTAVSLGTVISSKATSVGGLVSGISTANSTITSSATRISTASSSISSAATLHSTILSEVGSVGVKTSTAVSAGTIINSKATSIGTKVSTTISTGTVVSSKATSVGTKTSTVLSALHSLATFCSTRFSLIDSQVS